MRTKKRGQNMEIERKFWIQSLPDLPEENCSAVDQGYLCTEPVELRIRRRKEQKTGLTSYQLCIKSIGALSRHEVETALTQAQFEELAGRGGASLASLGLLGKGNHL